MDTLTLLPTGSTSISSATAPTPCAHMIAELRPIKREVTFAHSNHLHTKHTHNIYITYTQHAHDHHSTALIHSTHTQHIHTIRTYTVIPLHSLVIHDISPLSHIFSIINRIIYCFYTINNTHTTILLQMSQSQDIATQPRRVNQKCICSTRIGGKRL